MLGSERLVDGALGGLLASTSPDVSSAWFDRGHRPLATSRDRAFTCPSSFGRTMTLWRVSSIPTEW